MAKHKKGRKAGGTRRRRKVSGTAEIMHTVGQLLSAGVGGVVAVFGVNAVNTAMGSKLANVPWMPGAGAAATGGLIAGLAHKMPYAPEFGIGMATVGSILALNQAGLNMPGISGLAMSNNAPAGTSSLSKAVGCNRVGSGPSSYLNRTVGNYKKSMSAMAVGALASD